MKITRNGVTIRIVKRRNTTAFGDNACNRTSLFIDTAYQHSAFNLCEPALRLIEQFLEGLSKKEKM